ncbi:MAG: undecaprenyldiphospho-muramoylpentapeptide beta-N-acetylglucosaminyltransferase [Persephonella sp.]|nr:MAG: undecaprenyldiphospho-muramoylpentapeptide beta-N-acetylglucosaminyltransferase [Persephonella sp.]
MLDKKVFMAGGGTGGHYFPAIAMAETFYRRGYKIYFFGTKYGIEAKLDFPFGEKYLYDIKGIVGKSKSEKIKNTAKLLKTAYQISKIIRKEQPQFALVFGGYASAPLGIAVKLTGTRLYIHEQNSIPSSTNLLLSRLARKIFITFEYSFNHFPKKKTNLTGLPLRSLVKQDKFISKNMARKLLDIPHDKTVVLMFGGSQGAKKITEVGLEISKRRKDLFFIIITGKNFKGVIDTDNIKSFEFVERIGLLYKASDIVICRSGAGTVSEILYYGKPTVFIPYPYAFKNHQYYNVKWLKDRGLAQIILDKDLNVNTLNNAINNYLSMNLEDLSKKLEYVSIQNSEMLIYENITTDWLESLGV